MKQVFDVPERGDVVWLALSPRDGPGPSARRPAVVLSPQAYNARVGLAIVCPIVSRVTGYPFEVPVPPGLPVAGVILADQAVSLDWRACRAERICFLPSSALEEALGKIRSLL
ncbi:MAG: type II toxin-antitoxin system PemK/MazF family toxin [Candidatus Aminicenantales bacterium]